MSMLPPPPVFFLYLIPRGLRMIYPLLARIKHPIRVVGAARWGGGWDETDWYRRCPR
jgi:hypothetical protein